VTGAVPPPSLLVVPGKVLVSESGREDRAVVRPSELLGPSLGTVSVTPFVLVTVTSVVPSAVELGLRLGPPVPEACRLEEIGGLLAVSDVAPLRVGMLGATGAPVLLPYVGAAELGTIDEGVSVAGADVSLPVTGILEMPNGTLEPGVISGREEDSEDPGVGSVLAAVPLMKGAELLADVSAELMAEMVELGVKGAVVEFSVGSVGPPNEDVGLVSVAVGGGPLVVSDGDDSDDPSVDVGKDDSSVQVVSGTTVPEGLTLSVSTGPVVVAYVKLGR
jgi:hypothetical protein